MVHGLKKYFREYIPEIIFINVDFPAPFSPINACTVPFFNDNDTPFSAFTPENCFVIRFNSSNVVT